MTAAILVVVFSAGVWLGLAVGRRREDYRGGLDVNTSERKQMWIREGR